MKPEIRKRLSDILDTRQKQKDAVAAQASERQSAEEKNLAAFNAAKEKTIKPAFQEVMEVYKAKGMKPRIVERDEHRNEKGGIADPYIELDLSEDEDVDRAMKPHFRFIFDKRKRTVVLHISTRNTATTAGSPVPLDSLDEDWIHNAFAEYASR